MNFQLKPDEEILMQVHQYWIPFVPRLILFSVWFIIPWFFLYPLFRQGQWGVGLFALLILSSLFFGLRSWYTWSRTIFVVTNKRLIDIDQHGWFLELLQIFFTARSMMFLLRKKVCFR